MHRSTTLPRGSRTMSTGHQTASSRFFNFFGFLVQLVQLSWVMIFPLRTKNASSKFEILSDSFWQPKKNGKARSNHVVIHFCSSTCQSYALLLCGQSDGYQVHSLPCSPKCLHPAASPTAGSSADSKLSKGYNRLDIIPL